MLTPDASRPALFWANKRMNIRVLAARVLAPLLQHQGSLKAHLPEALKHCQPADRPLLQQLCYGTLRDFCRLEAIAQHLLAKPFRSRDTDIHALLLVGLYQLRSLRIPPHAAVSETVAGCAELDKGWATKLLNAVLRRYQREHSQIDASLGKKDCFHWNHPQWLIDKLRNNWPEHWQAILTQNDEPAPLTLRVNKRLLTRDAALELLESESIAAHACQYSPDGVTLESAIDVEKIPGFRQGRFSVQDEAAQLASQLLACRPHDRVLDACAAPGGKLCHLLEANSDLAEVIAIEMEPARAERIRDNLERMKLEHECTLVLGDASARGWWDGRPFDRILLDAPCSATGVIRRNPDIKLLRRNEDIAALAQLQLAMLSNLWSMLKPGGRLVYATCSVFPQENERIIERFLKQETDAEHCPIDASWGIERPYGRQLFPQSQGHDGFYYAMLQRR